MTLHSQALKWIGEKIGGKVAHGIGFYDYHGKYPDIIIREERRLKELHEVETISISEDKIYTYSKYDFRESRKQRVNRTLWIVLPRLDEAFHEVKMIAKRKGKGFDILAEVEVPEPYNLEPWRKKLGDKYL